ncbi:MAG TPA: alpha/beta hydrolase-fold protein [Thermoflexales bacterium]|nr:alpha/beta hydrolase-fold protein [Thermoflexales bacterium]
MKRNSNPDTSANRATEIAPDGLARARAGGRSAEGSQGAIPIASPHIAPADDPSKFKVTFVCESATQPRLICDLNDWNATGEKAIPMQKIERGVWAHEIVLPRNTYMEYAFVVGRKRRNDPRNPNKTDNGVGATNNYFYLPDAKAEPLAARGKGVKAGEVTRHFVSAGWGAVGRRRTVHLYHPPVKTATPLLVVLDGGDYLRRASICEIVDNLIAQKRIQPIALAMADSSKTARFIEYACSDAHVTFLTETVVPFAGQHLNLVDGAGAHGILGASMGGVMSLYTGLRAPQVFGKVFSQSGAFNVGDDETGKGDLVVYDLVTHGPRRDLQIYMDAGKIEWLLHTNRRMFELLKARGYAPQYREFEAGHNYPAWRDDLVNGLVFLFGESKN